ncbi:lactate/malate family dehydrogenase [Antribacter gilvus]|uniref:lactate/malate family dehydrogenase n=1 Tax=Antribacter gilvus TaxID=2304675 RepID=UPI000F79F7C8|nr:lactate dehydrogenase [Antribacter gilvus]
MDVAVLGATGDVGRQVCTQLIANGVLSPTSRLQLVGRRDGASGSAVHGLRTDLVDAFDERAPLLDVALSPEDVVADVVVVAAGATAPARVGASMDRARLAADNLAGFTAYAEALARHGSGHEVVIVVSNPVELGVAVFAEALGRHRVIGMGAWLDTLRFRREVALSLGVRRHRVSGFAGGFHGLSAVPLWSTVRIAGLDEAERRTAVAALRRGRTLDTFAQEVLTAVERLNAVAARDMSEAFAEVDLLPPDLRMVARPTMTHQSGAKTPAGTAGATVDLVRTLLDGREIVVAGQVALEREVLLSDGAALPGRVQGVPVVLGPEGWTQVLLDPLEPDEERLLAASGRGIDAMLASLLPGTPTAPGTPAKVAPGMPARAVESVPASAPETWEVDIEVVGADQVGIVATLTAVFATRGVAVDSVATQEHAGRLGTVALAFRAGERRARSLVRTLERLAMVSKVVVHRTR